MAILKLNNKILTKIVRLKKEFNEHKDGDCIMPPIRDAYVYLNEIKKKKNEDNRVNRIRNIVFKNLLEIKYLESD